MKLPLVGNLNSTHGHIFVAVVLLLVFSYVSDDNEFTRGPLEHLSGLGVVVAVLGTVYLLAMARTR